MERIDTFQLWLSERPAKTVILVGHCQFFFKLLPLSFRLRNSDIYEFTFSTSVAVDGSVTYGWTDGLLRFRSSLSLAHPWEALIKSLSNVRSNVIENEISQYTQSSGKEEKSCRICQVTYC